jgi:hypothetical protein
MMPYMKNHFHLTGDLVDVRKAAGEVDGGKVLLNTLALPSGEEYHGRYYADYEISLDVETFKGYRFLYWLINGEKRADAKTALKLTGPVTIRAVWEKNDNE